MTTAKPTAHWSAFFYMGIRERLVRARTVLILAVFANVIACGSSVSQWFADSAVDGHVHRGIERVYNLSFDSAKVEFQRVIKAAPDHPAGPFLLAMNEWWQIVINVDDDSHDVRFLSLLDNVLAICDKRLDKNEKDITALFFKGGALGFRGRLYAYREDWVKAANDGRMALPIVRNAYELAPHNYDVLLGMGIYNYYADVIPEQYPLVKPLMIFFPRGDKAKGLWQLKEASGKATYANTEAAYFLLQVLNNYEKRYLDALPLALELFRRFPNNPLFEKYAGRCHAALGNWSEMHEIFADIQRRADGKEPGYNVTTEREAQFYLGVYEMHCKNHEAALRYFYRCDELSRAVDKRGPSGFMVMTNLKIGMIYDAQSKRGPAVAQYSKVLKMDDYQDAHKQAEQYLKTPYSND